MSQSQKRPVVSVVVTQVMFDADNARSHTLSAPTTQCKCLKIVYCSCIFLKDLLRLLTGGMEIEKKQDESVEGHFQVTLVRGQNVQPNLQNSSSSSMSLIVFCIDISISAPLDPQILTAICQGEDDAPGTASLLSSHQKKKISS